MCRYIERAENTARMLDVNLQMSLMPQDTPTRESLWRAVLHISELQHGYDARYPAVTPLDVLHYMVREPANPSRSEEHTSELQSLMRISYAVFCLKKKTY